MSGTFDSDRFLADVPKIWESLYAVLASQSYVPTLVGGTVRDFFLYGHIGKDWDVELTHATHAFNKDTWKSLGKEFSKFGKVTFLTYEIIRLDVQGLQFEFSPPRKENYPSDWESKGHSNFTAEFDFKLPFESAVLRRDFTINAMGIRFHGLKDVSLMDPLNGLLHLRDKMLHPAGNDFHKDPVRFLRSIRFAQKFQFKFSPELESILRHMPLNGLSSTYVWSEMKKSGSPLQMFKRLLDWPVTLPFKKEELEMKWEELEKMLLDSSRHESWIIALEWIGVPAEKWQKFFSVSSETASRLSRWAHNSKKFIQIKPETFHGEFEEILKLNDFNFLFDWYFSTKQLLQKNPDLPLMKMIETYLPDWGHLYRFEAVKDVKHIDPPLRAKYQVWNLCQRL